MLYALKNYKALIYLLVHKEIRVRYRNSLFGFFWSLLEPLGLMIIYTVVFSFIIRFKVENYPLFVLSGLIPWMFLSNSLHRGAKSLTKNAALIKKVYFPRQIFPLTTVLANLVNFIPALGLVILLALLTEGGVSLVRLAALPGIVLLHFFFVLAIALVLSAMNVYYKDVELILTVVLRAWMYLSPIIYPLYMVPDAYLNIYLLNPMAVVLSMYRWVFFTDTYVPAPFIWYTIGLNVVLCVIAWKCFNRLSRRVGELI